MKKIILWSAAAILTVGLVAGGIWWLRRPKVITFSDGSTVTYMGADYGTLHIPPNIQAPGLVAHPELVQRSGSSFLTSNATLVVWVRQRDVSGRFRGFQYYLYDEAGTACVPYSRMNFDIRRHPNNLVVGLAFSAFPRRERKFLLGVEENGSGETAAQKFSVSNPTRRGPFAHWTPEPLPDTKTDGDLSVTLTRLVSGADLPVHRDADNPDDPVNQGVLAVLHIERDGRPVTNWQPVSVETSDATGNQLTVKSVGPNGWQNGNDTFTYQFGLWPDEPAWKIRFEFSEQSGFTTNELWTARHLPLRSGRSRDFYRLAQNRQAIVAAAETGLNGVHLTIFPATRFADAPGQGGLLIQTVPPLSNGERLTIVKLTDGRGNNVGFWENTLRSGPDASLVQCQLRDVSGVTNLNLTLALHRSRFVEFTVKPEKAAQ